MTTPPIITDDLTPREVVKAALDELAQELDAAYGGHEDATDTALNIVADAIAVVKAKL